MSERVALSCLWFSLVGLALAWGILTGIALARPIWLAPATALFGCFGVLVIGLSLIVAARSRSPR